MSVCPSVCHKPVLYRKDRTTRAGFWHGGFRPLIPHCVIRKFGYLQKLGHFPLALCPKLRTENVATASRSRCQQKSSSRRRRRRSSLLTTPVRQSTSRGCLLQVDQLLPSNSITSICCGFVNKILTDIARRAVGLR